jgi:hypothetical protein
MLKSSYLVREKDDGGSAAKPFLELRLAELLQ